MVTILFTIHCPLFTVYAQQSWTLDDCLHYARDHNIHLREQTIEVELSRNKLNTVKNDWMPTVDISAAQQFNFGNATASQGFIGEEAYNVDLSHTSGSLNVEIPVFDGFKRRNRQHAAEWSVHQAVASLEHARRNLDIQVATYYLQVLYEQGMTEVATTQVETSRRLCEKTRALVDDGKKAQSDLADVESKQASDEYRLTVCKSRADMALLALAQLLNLPAKEDFRVVPLDDDILQDNELPDASALYAEASDSHPAIGAAQATVEKSRYDVGAARADYFPRLEFKASLNTYYYNPFHSPTSGPLFSEFWRNKSGLIGLHLTIPVFNHFITRNNIRRAKMLYDQSQLRLSDTRQRLQKEIEQNYQSALDARDKYRSAQKSQEAARLAYAYEQDKYEAGRSTIYDLSMASQQLREAEENALQAKYEFIIRRKILEVYTAQRP